MNKTTVKKTAKKTTGKKNTQKRALTTKAQPTPQAKKKAASPEKKKTPLTDHYFENVQPQEIDLNLIDENPLNKRRFLDKVALEELAKSIGQYGLLHNIGLYPTTNGRYKLVFGYRRTLASRIAGKKTIAAKVAIVPDEHMKEIILTENIHHEKQHPIDEAHTIQSMLDDGKKPEDIALRLGKSRSFVDTRIKLLKLIAPLQELFFGNKLNLMDALLLATLSPDSQSNYFEAHCTGWQNDPDFKLEDVAYETRIYQYDLQRAPFDIKNKKIVPGIGACIGCDFNSATLTTLFPDENDRQYCKDKKCYQNKCTAHYSLEITRLYLDEKPEAIVKGNSLIAAIATTLESLECIKELPQYSPYNISYVPAPPAPQKESYSFEGGYFDEQGYNNAVNEHTVDMEEFNQLLISKQVLKALDISNQRIEAVYISIGEIKKLPTKVSGKSVQQAIKNGTDTPDMLKQEIERTIEKRDQLRKQAATETQQTIVDTFRTHISTFTNNRNLTTDDMVACRLLIYQTLSEETQVKANSVLGIPVNTSATGLLDKLRDLTEVQFAYLTRMALAEKMQSELSPIAICTERLAASAGVDVARIKQDSEEAAANRESLMNQRVDFLKARIDEISKEAA